MDQTRTTTALNYGKARLGSGNLIRAGKLVGSWGGQATTYDIKSVTKSIGSILIGVAIKDKRITFDTKPNAYVPNFATPPTSNLDHGWPSLITVRQLATQTAGFEKTGGFGALLFQPGTGWSYSDGGPNWLADLLTLRFSQDLRTVLRSRVLTPMHLGYDKVVWRTNAYRPHTLGGFERREFGSGISTSVDVMARLGLMLLRDGRWQTTQILPAAYTDAAGIKHPSYADEAGTHPSWLDKVACLDPDACTTAPRTKQYAFMFFTNADGHIANAPRDTYWAAGLGTSFIVVIPSLDIVSARAGPSWADGEAEHYVSLVAQAVQ
ncbi:MAG: serine hydrolase domain-containing protein [Geminicoccaceae bacterium]